MKIETFGYRGSFVFTAPSLLTNSSEELLIAATPYGNRTDLEDCLSEFLNEFERQSSDLDSTSPYPKLTCFSDYENLLYTTVQFLNDYMYSNFNREKINLGCDFFCLLKKENVIYFTQIGWPIILLNQNSNTLPICSDFSFTPAKKEQAPCLPTSVLGLESSINIKIQQLNITKNSDLLLLKSNESPETLMNSQPLDLQSIASSYAKISPEQGLWLGKVSL
jgi:hypothetical protein